ncbi:MAG TPA: hypothetical protein VI423_10880 [Paenisporosarcina sp.]|nr:hypothetical protein [Paenisporosarcina sp.]
MKVLFYLPNCTLGELPSGEYYWSANVVDCYWVEATWHEAQNLIGEAIDVGAVPKNTRLVAMDDPRDHENFYFLVAKDISRLMQMFWVWHCSAMNRIKDEFVWIEPFEIDCLADLQAGSKGLMEIIK